MIEADRVHSTPPLNSSSVLNDSPRPEAPSESVDSFFQPTAIGQPESGNLASDSRKPAKGLSRRAALAGLAVLSAAVPAALPAAAAAPDPVFALIEAHKVATAAHEASIYEADRLKDLALCEKPCLDDNLAFEALLDAPSTTLPGLVAKLAYLRTYAADGEQAWMLDEREGGSLALIDSIIASLKNVGVLS
jgi:hypothetical protein